MLPGPMLACFWFKPCMGLSYDDTEEKGFQIYIIFRLLEINYMIVEQICFLHFYASMI